MMKFDKPILTHVLSFILESSLQITPYKPVQNGFQTSTLKDYPQNIQKHCRSASKYFFYVFLVAYNLILQ